ncbi:MAG: septum site-determining protein MinD [Candidatus Eremiobacteraeota bacterium]|nr:septum site-determining protein MinD [Candidatus Eremiobacteraeota bacterium]
MPVLSDPELVEAQSAGSAQAESEASKASIKLGRAIVLTSGKGGVGKTTTTANLGTALAVRGARVVLIDADVGLRNLDIVLGLESRVRHHLLDVLEDQVDVDEALVADKHTDRLFLLAAAQAREKDDVVTSKMQALVSSLRERFDYVLIDSPAGIELGFKNAVAGADEAIVICTPEVAAVRDVDRVVGLLGNRFRPQLVINRLRPQLVRKGKMLSVEDVNGILRLPLLGVIADEPEIIVTTNRGEPLALRAQTATGAAYHAIAARIAGEDAPVPMPPVSKPGLLERFGSLLGGKRR